METHIVVVSDLHCGCRFGLCPPKVTLESGGIYQYNEIQKILWREWLYFWNRFIPEQIGNNKFILVVNGDAIDGDHRKKKTTISRNYADQIEIAKQVLSIPLKKENCRKYYHIRGTEAHVGSSGEYEELLARELNAQPVSGAYSVFELYYKTFNTLLHFTHHVSTVGTAAYEVNGIFRELNEMLINAGRWQSQTPQVVVRSHRHMYSSATIPTAYGLSYVLTTPGWQAKTPYVYRQLSGRAIDTVIGGVLLTIHKTGNVNIRPYLVNIQTKKEVIYDKNS